MASRGIPRIFVGNLPWTIGRKELRDYFSQFGQIQAVNVFFDKDSGISRNFGFVQFGSRDGYLNSSRETSHFLEGNRLTVTDVNANMTSGGARSPGQNSSQFARNRQQGGQRSRNFGGSGQSLSTNISHIMGGYGQQPAATPPQG